MKLQFHWIVPAVMLLAASAEALIAASMPPAVAAAAHSPDIPANLPDIWATVFSLDMATTADEYLPPADPPAPY